MPKIALIGAGSTVFARTLIGDILSFDELTAAELDLDQIWSLVDELIQSHEGWLPELR